MQNLFEDVIFLGRTCPKSQRVVVPEASQLSSFTMVSLLDSKRMCFAKDAHMAVPDFDVER